MGRDSGERLKDLLSAGERAGWPRGVDVSAICRQEWRPRLEGTGASGQDRPACSALAVGPQHPGTQLAGCLWAGLARASARISLHQTPPTRSRGEDEALLPLRSVQAEIRIDRTKAEVRAAGELNASPPMPGWEPC